MSGTAFIKELKASALLQTKWEDQLTAFLNLNVAVASIYGAAASLQDGSLRPDLTALGQGCQNAMRVAEGSKMSVVIPKLREVQRDATEAARSFSGGSDAFPFLKGLFERMKMVAEVVLMNTQSAEKQYATAEAAVSQQQDVVAASGDTARTALEDASRELKTILTWYGNVIDCSRSLSSRVETLLNMVREGLTEESSQKCTGLVMQVHAMAGIMTAAYQSQQDVWMRYADFASQRLDMVGGDSDNVARLVEELRQSKDANIRTLSKAVSESKEAAVQGLEKREAMLNRY